MIPATTDENGHSLKLLLHLAIQQASPDAVFRFANDQDAIVRAIAARRLATDKLLEERAYRFALELSDDPKSKRRELSAYLLGQIGTPKYPYKTESVAILEKLAKDRSAAVRGAAIVALGHLEAKSSKTLILESLDDPDAGVVDSASYALWAIGRTEKDKRRLCAAVKRFDSKTRQTIDLWDD